MRQGDKAIALVDGAVNVDRLTKGLDEKVPAREIQALHSSFLYDLLGKLIDLSSTSLFVYSDNYLDRIRRFGPLQIEPSYDCFEPECPAPRRGSAFF